MPFLVVSSSESSNRFFFFVYEIAGFPVDRGFTEGLLRGFYEGLLRGFYTVFPLEGDEVSSSSSSSSKRLFFGFEGT